MINITQILDDTERRTNKLEEERLKIILENVVPNVLLKKNKNLIYSQLLQLILFDPKFEKYRNQVWESLLQLNVNERNIIHRFFNIIYSPINDNLIKMSEIQYFNNSPYISNYKILNNGYYYKTAHGEITGFRLNTFLSEHPLSPFLKAKDYSRLCHYVVEHFSHLVTNGFAITSEIDSLFGDVSYHSYFEQEDWILDIAENTLYLKESFQNYYTPKELIRIPTSEVANEIAKIPKDLDKKSKNYFNLLKLALLNKRK